MGDCVYRVRKIRINRNHELFSYCDRITALANNLSNAVRFRQRQVITASGKSPAELSANETEVLEEFRDAGFTGTSMSYGVLDLLLKKTGNPDYHAAGLPRQTAQQAIRQCIRDMDSYFRGISAYKKDPSAFTGRPELPGYHRKGGHCTAVVTNQDAVLYRDDAGCRLKLPLTRTRLETGFIGDEFSLREVKVIPDNGTYLVSVVLMSETEVPEPSGKHERMAAVDPGVENLMAVTNNCGLPCLLYKGGAAKSVNRLYNKKVAALVSEQTLLTGKKYVPDTEYMKVTVKRNDSVSDLMHKTAKHFITWCVENRIDTIVIGDNAGWKQESRMDHVRNQNFVQLPFDSLKWMVTYLAGEKGISVIRQEESYTSQASFPDMDSIPVYHKGDTGEHVFSGRRGPHGHRGLYVTSDGTVINSDLNGSANILRKAFPDAFAHGTMPDFGTVEVIRHPDSDRITALRDRQLAGGHTDSRSKQKRMRRKAAAQK